MVAVSTRGLRANQTKYQNQVKPDEYVKWSYSPIILEIQALADLINKYHRCYDQKGYINK